MSIDVLVKAYEKGHDHAGALLYLGELVEFLGKSQVSAVRGKLEAIRERAGARFGEGRRSRGSRRGHAAADKPQL